MVATRSVTLHSTSGSAPAAAASWAARSWRGCGWRHSAATATPARQPAGRTALSAHMAQRYKGGGEGLQAKEEETEKQAKDQAKE